MELPTTGSNRPAGGDVTLPDSDIKVKGRRQAAKNNDLLEWWLEHRRPPAGTIECGPDKLRSDNSGVVSKAFIGNPWCRESPVVTSSRKDSQAIPSGALRTADEAALEGMAAESHVVLGCLDRRVERDRSGDISTNLRRHRLRNDVPIMQ
jgi:hypothetical protein